MTKTTINGTTDFRANVKAYTQPKVIDSYMDDNGDKMLVLDNGREQSETRYNALWMPHRGIIDWKCKGNNPDAMRKSIYSK